MTHLVLLILAAAAPRAAVVVHATGFPDDDTKRLQEKVGAEVTASGAELWTLSKALSIKSECLEDRACAHEVLRTADAVFLLWIEAVRAGGQVQLDAKLLDVDGRVVADADGAARIDELLGAGSAVAPEVLAPLRAAAAAAAGSAPPPPPPPPHDEQHKDAPLEPLTPEHAAGDPPGPPPLSSTAIAGIATLSAGALLAVGGSAIAASQINVIRDATSLGNEKQAAANTATAMIVVAAAGVGAAGAGAVLLYLGL